MGSVIFGISAFVSYSSKGHYDGKNPSRISQNYTNKVVSDRTIFGQNSSTFTRGLEWLQTEERTFC